MNRKQVVFTVLGAFFLTNAIVAEMIGSKLIYFFGEETTRLGPLGPFTMSIGVVPWPIVFVATDLINEYFGRRGVRRLTLLTAVMITYAYFVLWATMQFPAAPGGIDGESYNKVFGQSRWIIVGSLVAFLVSQLLDVAIFHLLRRRTGKALLWLRSTGSTIFSQLIDSVIVLYIGLAIPYGWDMRKFASTAATNYSVKLLIAVAATPLIYLGHWLVELYLGKPLAEALAEEAAMASGDVAPLPHGPHGGLGSGRPGLPAGAEVLEDDR